VQLLSFTLRSRGERRGAIFAEWRSESASCEEEKRKKKRKKLGP